MDVLSQIHSNFQKYGRSYETCMSAVRQCGLALIYINNQTEDLCILAVKQNAKALMHVHTQTYAICLAAIETDPVAIQYVQAQFRTDSLCIQALRQNAYVIKHITNPTFEMCMVAVQTDGYVLKCINNSILLSFTPIQQFMLYNTSTNNAFSENYVYTTNPKILAQIYFESARDCTDKFIKQFYNVLNSIECVPDNSIFVKNINLLIRSYVNDKYQLVDQYIQLYDDIVKPKITDLLETNTFNDHEYVGYAVLDMTNSEFNNRLKSSRLNKLCELLYDDINTLLENNSGLVTLDQTNNKLLNILRLFKNDQLVSLVNNYMSELGKIIVGVDQLELLCDNEFNFTRTFRCVKQYLDQCTTNNIDDKERIMYSLEKVLQIYNCSMQTDQ